MKRKIYYVSQPVGGDHYQKSYLLESEEGKVAFATCPKKGTHGVVPVDVAEMVMKRENVLSFDAKDEASFDNMFDLVKNSKFELPKDSEKAFIEKNMK